MGDLEQVFEDDEDVLIDVAVGDIVRLVSGGPYMTIMDISHDVYTCIWFTFDNRLQNARFVPACVEYISPEDLPQSNHDRAF